MSHGKRSRFPLSSRALAATGRTVAERFVVRVETPAFCFSKLRLQVHSATCFFFLFARAPHFFCHPFRAICLPASSVSASSCGATGLTFFAFDAFLYLVNPKVQLPKEKEVLALIRPGPCSALLRPQPGIAHYMSPNVFSMMVYR